MSRKHDDPRGKKQLRNYTENPPRHRKWLPSVSWLTGTSFPSDFQLRSTSGRRFRFDAVRFVA